MKMDDQYCTYGLFVLLVCMSVNTVRHVQCQSVTDAKNLKTQLFTTEEYDPAMRPLIDQSRVIDVFIDYHLLSISSLSATDETLRTSGYLFMYWFDDFLTWNESEYGGLFKYYWNQNVVWRPDVVLRNSNQDYKKLGIDELLVENWSDGRIYWYPYHVFVSTCSLDITYFPYDVQTCYLDFSPWSYSKYEINMINWTTGIVTDFVESNAQWNVLNYYVKTNTIVDSESTNIEMYIVLQRKPLFVMLSTMMPIVMLSTLNIFVFVLPCESGERAGYAITTFLAFAVFLTIVTATLPENSDTVAIFSIYVILQTSMSTIITLIALSMLRLHSFHGIRPVPKCLVRVTNFLNFKCCMKDGKKNRVSSVDKESPRANIQLTVITITSETDESCRNTPISEDTMTWVYVINTFDTVCFIFFGVFSLLSPIICFLISARNT